MNAAPVAMLLLGLCCVIATGKAKERTKRNTASCAYHKDHKNFEDYLGLGYDIFQGDPLNSELSVDPGLRYRVFNMSSCEDDALPNLKCKSKHVSEVIKSADEYRDEIMRSVGAEVGVGYGPFSASFSASHTYKHIETKTNEEYRVYIVGEAACTLYTSVLGRPQMHKLTDDFKKQVTNLMDNLASNNFLELVNEFLKGFGTHFMDRVAMGGKYGEIFDLTEIVKKTSSLTEQTSELKAKVEARLTASLSVGVSNSNSDIHGNSHSQTDKRITSQTYSFGSRPPLNGSERDWAATAEIDPVPIGFSLKKIYEAITPNNLVSVMNPDQREVQKVYAVRDGVKEYLEKGGYCNYLKSQKTLKSCDGVKKGNTACRLCPQRWGSDCEGRYSKYGGQFLQRQTLRNGGKLKESKAVAYDEECSGVLRSRKLDLFDNGCDDGRCGEGKVNLCCAEEQSCMLCASCGGSYPVDTGPVLNEYGGKLKVGPARREQTGMAAWGWGASCGGGKQSGQMHICCSKGFGFSRGCQWVPHEKTPPIGFQKAGEPWGIKKGALWCPNL